MPAQEGEANLCAVLGLLAEWDRGNRAARSRILREFVSENSGRTCPELELQFAQVASLFLARITTWMRLTYKFGTFLGLQLKVIKIFLSASSHDQYLSEFLEDGGLLTLIDILNHAQIKAEVKAEVLEVLLIISNTGRKYKEFVCGCNGVRALAEYSATSHSDETQGKAWAVLDSLSHGNPHYLNHVYKEVIAVLTVMPPSGQKMVLTTLQSLQSKMKTADHSLVDPLLQTLKTLRLEVQDQAINLILDLLHLEVRPLLLKGLVALLRPAREQLEEPHNAQSTVSELDRIKTSGSLSVFVQQAAAARVIRLLTEDNEEIRRELLCLEVVHHLLFAIGNKEHRESQIQASLALQHFIRVYPEIQEPVQITMGETVFSAFMSNPETLYMTIDETQAEMLLFNNVRVNRNAGVTEEHGNQ